MNEEEVLKLAKLARIEISNAEAKDLAHEFEAILKYVGEVKKVTAKDVPEALSREVNVMRADEGPHESGIYTEKILAEAPDREDDYLKVKKIL
jgi:aspartyl-tRNA(Asn)/glutamyl-tRNA(Gln) amidotransferase subunit C